VTIVPFSAEQPVFHGAKTEGVYKRADMFVIYFSQGVPSKQDFFIEFESPHFK
jgi:hypothetical protein